MTKNINPSIQKLVLTSHNSLIDALEVINAGSKGIALILSDNNRLVGVLTDGDIRRGMLRGQKLDSSVGESMNISFKSITKDSSEAEALSLMRSLDLRHLPVVDEHGFLVDLICLDDLLNFRNLPNSVVIMAGGKGTRLLPHTLSCPKPMLPVGGKPMLEILIKQCISAGLVNIYISVNYLKEQIIEYFGDGSALGASISYLVEDTPLGTAGSLHLLPPELDAPFLVMNGDVLTHLDFRHLIEFHQSHGGIATVCGREHEITIPYGVINHEGSTLIGLEEKPSLNYLVNAGLYILDPLILPLLKKGVKLDMPELLTQAKQCGHQVNVCPVHEYWLDVGRPETLAEAHRDWNHLS